MAERIEVFARLSLVTIMVLTQTSAAYSIDVSTLGTNNVSNCGPSNSDFGTDFKRLTETIEEGTDIPEQFLQKHFSGCTIENARELLVKNGFRAEDLESAYEANEPNKVIPRNMIAAKTIRAVGQYGSFNCRIILQTDASNRVSAQGFFYFDGP